MNVHLSIDENGSKFLGSYKNTDLPELLYVLFRNIVNICEKHGIKHTEENFCKMAKDMYGEILKEDLEEEDDE